MTNGWIDIKNTDMMLIMGGNPAENHPCGFKWAIEAKKTRNAKMIVVDPRFTRTPRPRTCSSRFGREPTLRFWAALFATPWRTTASPRVSRQLHQRRLHREGRIQAAGGRPVLRL